MPVLTYRSVAYFAVLSTFLIPLPIAIATEVSGEQSGTWAVSGSPYEIVGDVTVPSGNTLTIEAWCDGDLLGLVQDHRRSVHAHRSWHTRRDGSLARARSRTSARSLVGIWTRFLGFS